MKAFFLRRKKLHIWLASLLAFLALFWAVRGNRGWMNAFVQGVTTPFRQAVGRLCYRVEFSVAEVLCVALVLFSVGYLLWAVVTLARKGARFRPSRSALWMTVWLCLAVSLLLTLPVGLYIRISAGIFPWRALLPRAVAPWALGGMGWLALYLLWDQERRRWAYALLLGAVCAAGTVYCGFCLLWGADYYTDSFQDRSGIYAQDVAPEDLAAVTEYFAQRLAETADAVPRDEAGVFSVDKGEILSRAPKIYDAVEAQFPFLEFDDPGVKPVFFSRIMSWTDFTGVYCPFTGESNLNMDCPACLLPSTVAHELAHQRGVASEQECNFLAVLASTTSQDPAYVYSGWLLGYIHLGNALYRADPDAYWAMRERLSETVKADLADHSAYWAQFEGNPVQTVSTTVYEGFLQSYGEERGMQSYGAVVDLLVVYYKDAAR